MVILNLDRSGRPAPPHSALASGEGMQVSALTVYYPTTADVLQTLHTELERPVSQGVPDLSRSPIC